MTHKELDALTRAIADVLPVYLEWQMRPLEREVADLRTQVAYLRGERDGAAQNVS